MTGNSSKFVLALLGVFGLAPLPVLAITPVSIDGQTPNLPGMGEPVTMHRLEELAEQISVTNPPDVHGAQVPIFTLDLKQLPILGDLVDRDGRLQLPLGLTVYNAMGNTSIGFGSKF